MDNSTNKGRGVALLPIIIFLVIFLGSGAVTGDFYSTPAIVAFLIALMVAFFQNRELNFQEKISVITKGVGDENIITMSLIFLSAGAFSGAVTAAGGVESTVNLGRSLLPTQIVVPGLFLIGCFIAISMGTSMGTISTLAPIAVGISETTGFSMGICIGAVVCGAMFGDNLSMISDTTIAAVKTQGCEMKDKFKANFLIVLPAALVTIFVFYFRTMGIKYDDVADLPYNIWRVVPYLVVLIGALVGVNVFIVLITGTVLSVIVGLATGSIAPTAIFTGMGEGITGMYDITVISIIVACIVSLVKAYGGIDYILYFIKSRIRSSKGAEFAIAILAFLVDACTANNTVAIVIAGPVAKEISDEFHISPKRSASLLDIFAAVGQGVIPYGAQLLLAASLTGLTPFNILPFLFYPIFMAISAILFIMFRRRPEVVS